MIKIKQIDNIHAQITKGLEYVQKILEYEAEHYIQGRWKKERQVYTKKVYTKSGKILAGLVPYIVEYCEKQKIDCEVVQNDITYPAFEDRELLGITLRPDQKKLVQAALEHHRGVIVAPTGSGKTILISSIINKYPNAEVLVLAHTTSLIDQLHETFEQFNFDCGRFTGKYKELDHRITCATIQSAKKINKKIDIVIVDETHHVSSKKGMYGKFLSHLQAPIRLGFSATPQTEGESWFAQTGLLGSTIGELTWEEGTKVDILAVPKIVFIRTPDNPEIKKVTKYADAVKVGITKCNRRNKQIVKKIEAYIKKGKSSLVLIQNVEHGINIQKMAELFGFDIPFVRGDTDADTREKVKKQLDKKEIMSVIASPIWYEGISINSVDAIFLASPIKKPAALLQRIGRGLRKTEGKDKVIIVDFLDLNSRFFVNQLGHRLAIYSERDWL